MLASRYPVESVLLAERFVEAWHARLPPALPVYVLPTTRLSNSSASIFIAVCWHAAGGLSSLHCWKLFHHPPQQVSLVVLPDVQSPENLGVILRISAAFGVDAVLLGPRAGDPLSRRVLRTSMGYALHVPLITLREPFSELATLATEQELTLIATALDSRAADLRAIEPRPRQAILLAAKATALSQTICDFATISLRSP